MRKFGIYCGVAMFLFNTNVMAAGTWLPFMSITDDYWGKVSDGQNFVLVLDSTFNTCGWNAAVDIRESVVGAASFKTLTAVALAAIIAKKKISVYIDGCIDDRAKGMAFRVQQ